MSKWRIGLAQVCGAAGILLWINGHEYLTVGYGIHPMLAGAGVMAAILLPYFLGEEDY